MSEEAASRLLLKLINEREREREESLEFDLCSGRRLLLSD